MSEQATFDPRAESLRQVGDVITAIARHHCGVDVDETTQERWRQLMGLMREFDTLHDNGVDTDTDLSANLSYLTDRGSPFFMRYPELFPDRIEPESYAALLARTRSIIALGAVASATTDLDRYIAVRTDEAAEAAGLLADSATPYVSEQPAFSGAFMDLACHTAISANFYDSFVDARIDARAGQLNVEADFSFYRRAGTLAVRHFMPLPAVLLHPPVVAAFIPMARHGIANKLKYDENGALRFTRRQRAIARR